MSVTTTHPAPPASPRRRRPRLLAAATVLVVATGAALAVTHPWTEDTPDPAPLTAPYCGVLPPAVVSTALGRGPVLARAWSRNQSMDLRGYATTCSIQVDPPPAAEGSRASRPEDPHLLLQRIVGSPGSSGEAYDVLRAAWTEIGDGSPGTPLVRRTGTDSARGSLEDPDGTTWQVTLDDSTAADPVAAASDVLLSTVAAHGGDPAPASTAAVAGVVGTVGDGPVCGVWSRATLVAARLGIARATDLQTTTVRRRGWRSCYLHPLGAGPDPDGFPVLSLGVLDPVTAARMPEVVAAEVADGASSVDGGLGWALLAGGSAHVRVVVGGVLVALDAGLDTTPDDPAFQRLVDEAVDAARTAGADD